MTPRRTANSPTRVLETGQRLATKFWQAAGNGERWLRRQVAPHSPLEVLVRLYGPAAPALAVGLPPGQPAVKVAAVTARPWPGLPEATSGFVSTGPEPYSFTLRWQLDAGKPVLLELLPYLDAVAAAFPAPTTLAPGVLERLRAGPPPPRCHLDPVAATLLDTGLPLAGLPLVARCLAAWWRLDDSGAVLPDTTVVTAAALLEVVGARARVPEAKRAAAAFGGDPAEVSVAARALRSRLRLSEARPW